VWKYYLPCHVDFDLEICHVKDGKEAAFCSITPARCSNKLLAHLEHLRETKDLFAHLDHLGAGRPGEGTGVPQRLNVAGHSAFLGVLRRRRERRFHPFRNLQGVHYPEHVRWNWEKSQSGQRRMERRHALRGQSSRLLKTSMPGHTQISARA